MRDAAEKQVAVVHRHGPPFAVAGGTGLTPADFGPTRKRKPSKRPQIEPPPAAMVGSASSARGCAPRRRRFRPPARTGGKCDTSVEVPPISKAIPCQRRAARLRRPCRRPHPLGRKDCVLAANMLGVGSRHSIAEIKVGASGSPRLLVDVAPKHRRQIGVDHGRVAASDQPDQRRDIVVTDTWSKPRPRAMARAWPHGRCTASRASGRSPAHRCHPF